MARALVFARNEGFMRLQPLYGLAVLSAHRPDLFAQIFLDVVKIPSDLVDFLTILQGMGRGEGGRAVKRQINRFLSGVTEYWALKYNGRGRGYSLGDAIATAHPKPADMKQQALFRYLRGHEANMAVIPQVDALEKLKRATTEAEQIHWIEQGKLPYETVTGAIKPTVAVWEALLHQMSTFALLRHLHTLARAGVFANEEHLAYAIGRLTDREALQKARILPWLCEGIPAGRGTAAARRAAGSGGADLCQFAGAGRQHGDFSRYIRLDERRVFADRLGLCLGFV